MLERSGTGTLLPEEVIFPPPPPPSSSSSVPVFTLRSRSPLLLLPNTTTMTAVAASVPYEDEHEIFPTQLSLLPSLPAFGLISSTKPKLLNHRKTRNEDRMLLSSLSNGMTLAGVFDGHGGKARCSHFVSQRFQSRLEEKLQSSQASVEQALVDTFLQLDGEFRAEVESQPSFEAPSRNKSCCQFFNENPCLCGNPRTPANEGSTGTVVLVTSEFIYCANVGDSDAVCYFKPPAVTGPKKPRLEAKTWFQQLNIADTPLVDELNEDYLRIREIAQLTRPSSGSSSRTLPRDGILTNPRGERFSYVAVAGARSLNMVRAFGNLGNKTFDLETGELVEPQSAIICRPHVQRFARTADMECLVLGSDGLWDNVTQQEVGGEVTSCNADPQRLAEQLLNLALTTKRKPDDVSVLVLSL
ncbi:hypothetical protein BASA81_000964 [Batrachochytrium salamandrivorans]|nr:hypothetical protein BASA81_000964 [Batrachochytrium salamandrivorans]